MLDELSKKDKLWRKMSLQICKDKNLADEIVQEMYLKLHNKDYNITDGFIYVVLNSLFLDVKKKKNRYIDINYDFVDNSTDYDIEYDLLIDKALVRLPSELKKLSFVERELLLLNQEMSRRKISDQAEINFRFINKTINNTKLKLCQNLKK
jgi:DNA-directed RNA polymerase specialized sigma24 family protein